MKSPSAHDPGDLKSAAAGLPFSATQRLNWRYNLTAGEAKKIGGGRAMKMTDIPFGTTDWSEVERTEHPGETGVAYARSRPTGQRHALPLRVKSGRNR